MPTLLVVDDETNVRYSLKKGLARDGLEIATAATGAEGLELFRRLRPNAMILDVRLPDLSGLDVFERVKEIDPRLPVIIVTAYASTDTAINAMKRGAYEYLLKPVDLLELRSVVGRALDLSRMSRIPAVFDAKADDEGPVERIVGQSPAMQEVYKAIGRVAPQNVPVLVLGESGTGKELIARALYHHSRRSSQPFLAINCAAIPESLLESELFGHERGAFTGAERLRIGKFEQCHGGTIFLDEIGDMSLATQAKMLRLLQDGRFERVGGNQTIQSDVRIIAATNRDLDTMVVQGAFRLDLLYRLNVFTIRVPPLRDRLEDLAALVEHFIGVQSNVLGKPMQAVSPVTMELLRSHHWPGNVRELQSAIKYALVHSVGEVLMPDCLPPSCHAHAVPEATSPAVAATLDIGAYVRQLLNAGELDIYRHMQNAFDRIVLREVLNYVRGNQVKASQLLGMSRTTLRAKLGGLALGDGSAPMVTADAAQQLAPAESEESAGADRSSLLRRPSNSL
jgi:two-component system nitrogen regulation response regulator GlnG